MDLSQDALDHYKSFIDSAESDEEREELLTGIEQHHAQDNYLVTDRAELRGFGQQALGRTQPTQNKLQSLPNQRNKDAAIDASGGDMITGFKRGVQNLQAMNYGAAALAGRGLENLGLEGAGQATKDFGREGYRRNVEEAKQYVKRHSFKDVYTGEAGIGGTVDWIQGTLGELVPTMVEAAVGAVIGGAIGSSASPAGTVAGAGAGAFAGRTLLKKAIEKGMQQAVKKGMSKTAEAELRKQVTKQAMKKLGAKVGMGAAVMPMESGGMYAELLEEKGIDAPGTALFFGALATSMEYFGGNSKLIDTFVDALSTGSAGLAKKTAKELLTNIPQEALQEGGQEALGILNKVVNTGEEFFTAENIEQIIEGMGAGAVGGGAGAVVSSTMNAQADASVDLITQQFENIKSGGSENISASVTKLNNDIVKNNQLLQDTETLEALAADAGMDLAGITAHIERTNADSQELSNRLQEELANPGQVVADQAEAVDIDNLISQAQARKQDRENKQLQVAGPLNTIEDKPLPEPLQDPLADPLLDQFAETAQDTQAQADITARRRSFETLQEEARQENVNLYNAVKQKIRTQRQADFTEEEAAFFAKYNDAAQTEKNLLSQQQNKAADLIAAETALDDYQPDLPKTDPSSFIDEQQVVEPTQVDQAEQVVPLEELESQLAVNEQQLAALAEQIKIETDPDAQLALRQEGSALYEQNTLLNEQLDAHAQIQLQDDFTVPETGAEFELDNRVYQNTLLDESLGNAETLSTMQNPDASTTTLHDILIQTKQDEGLTGQLAEFMSQFIPESKLDVPVIINPNARSASYNRNEGITIQDPSRLKSSLHEIVHAVTVRELDDNPEAKAKVTALMGIVSDAAIKSAHITPAQLADIQAAGSSRGFKERFPRGSELDSVAQLGYALLNEKEFLSQAFSSKQVQGFMQSIQIKDQDTGTFMTLWDKFISLIMNSLGIPKTQNTAFGEALKLTAELSQADVTTPTALDNITAVSDEALATDIGPVAQKRSEASYRKDFAEKNNVLQNLKQMLNIRGKDFALLSDKLLGSISTRLGNASPLLKAKMRQLDFDTSQSIIDSLHIAKPLLLKTKEMSAYDKHAWDAARKDADTGKIQQIAQKYGMTEDMEAMRDRLDKIRKDAVDVGYEVGFIDDYWPRIIKDQEGFLQATQGISDRADFSDAIKAKAEKMGITVNELNAKFPEVRADVISSMILGHGKGLGGPGNIQSRKYEVIPDDLKKFYMNSDAALMQYIFSMTKKIEARKFFGKVPPKIQGHKNAITKAQEELTKIGPQINKYNDNPEVSKIMEDRVKELNDRITLHEEKLNKYKEQRDYTENIGAYIDGLMISGDLNKKHEKSVRDILEARFNEHGTTGAVNAYKNMAYIDVMGNPISALTQIGDLAWAAYVGKAWTPKGFSNTVKNAINATLNKSKVTKEDLGLERIAQEFADGTTLGNAVSNVFKMVGLTKMDSIGKETLINNALMNYQEQVKTPEGIEALKKKIRPTFGIKTDQVIKELAANDITDNVKMLLYSRLLDFQPAALSEMPEMYLKGGNGRVFYMLKTYTLKQMDVFRNEVVKDIRSDDPKQVVQGIKNMTALLSMLTLANAGADELKDFVLGKETKFKDNVIENFLTIGGASRYMQMQVTREGLGSAMTQKILPPMKFVDSISQDLDERITTGDVADGGRVLDSIPGVGKWAYWHYGRGSKNKKTIEEQDFKKASKKIRKFKKQFEKATDKRLFLQANPAEFKQMKLHQNFQGALNRNKAESNKLEKLDQTPAVTKRLGQLNEQRRGFIDSYFKAADNLAMQ